MLFICISGDDEYDFWKAETSRDMKKRMGIHSNPLDNTYARTRKSQYMFQYFLKVVSTQFKTIDGAVVRPITALPATPPPNTLDPLD